MSAPGSGPPVFSPAIPAKPRLPPAAAAAYWLAPSLLCLALYWRGLLAWFQADDFAWLSLRGQVTGWQSLWHVLFAPMAQGTIRPWSERAFFVLFESAFGLRALPFRICVILTQCASLTLLAAVAGRITRSRKAGFWAPVLWSVNPGLTVAMIWTSAYNQILCGFFLLAAFWFLLRYIETGRGRDNFWQWVLFLAGFGALEINVVYPALAALYCWLCARAYFRLTLPLFLPSAAFTVAHMVAAPAASAGAYALHFQPAALLATFGQYWRWALVSAGPALWGHARLRLLLLTAFTLALGTFAVVRALRRDWLPLFCLGWFVIVLAPVLPLRDHISDYYLAVPLIGLAMLGAYAIERAWSGPAFWKLAAAGLALLYLGLMVRINEQDGRFWYTRSLAVERMVLGVARAHQLHPDKAILLDGVDDTLFWAGVLHHPFTLFGAQSVYLTPESANAIEPLPSQFRMSDYVLPPDPLLHAVKSGSVVVYRIGPARLKEVTSKYEQAVIDRPPPDPPRRVDAGSPLMSYLLGPEWYPPEGGTRWMGKHATLRMGGPPSLSEKLYLNGYRSPAESAAGPLVLRIRMDGLDLKQVSLNHIDTNFQMAVAMPPELAGRRWVEVDLDCGRTFHTATDSRDLGLLFGTFEIR